MDEAISERFSIATENCAGVENYLLFTGEKETDRNDHIDGSCNVVIKNVMFHYPLSKSEALSNINLTILKGETIAIVGENGSGKSTLCKLILGLYEPTEGSVLYNHQSTALAKYGWASAVFQRYNRYKMTLRKNLQISELAKPANDDGLVKLCIKAGVYTSQKDAQIDLNTILSREFSGVELSSGEWQRVAIARGLYKDSDILVLDEPTAAIDPIEETRLYNDFICICKGKTAMIVTHRLGSARIADRIIVLKNGRIVQDGVHEDLLKIDGEYKDMYLARQKWYVDEPK